MCRRLGIYLIFSLFAAPCASHAQDAQNICKIYNSYKDDGDRLIDKYQTDIGAKDSNELRHEALINSDKARLDRVFEDRNNAVYQYTHGGKVRNFVVIVDKIESSLEDYGDGAKNYGYINAHIPCDPIIGILIPKIPNDSRWGPLLTSLNAGDSIEVSGRFIAHDEDNQRPADAVQWGGPLWGILWNLRASALQQPSLQVTPDQMQKLPTQSSD